MNNVKLLSERLYYETLQEHHAEECYELLNDEKIYRYTEEACPTSIEALKDRYQFLAKGSSNKSEKWLNWIVFEKNGKRAIGTLQATVMKDAKVAYLAYMLAPPYWGKGYATESVDFLLHYLAEREQTELFIAEIDTKNTASVRLIEKFDFALKETIATSNGHDHVFEKRID